ncbi:hypothetical protein [Paludisphaera mucosa]|uniref:Lipoprotein n=1 Tax=Paludisphaera mucosa TaxID=3030827 RepID=A0ABT6FJ83_9BACT|nr:hypothetical protein [Paludisphaera mucosa]MDG3007650.1 hypothetical protein [Paludisphaera mucosa]
MTSRTPAFCLTTALLLAIGGCEEPRQVKGSKKKNAVAHGAAPSAEKKEPEFIVGKRTTDIRRVEPEVAQGANVIEKPKITAKDPITLQGNAYVTMIGQTSILQIQHAMNLYQAANDRLPKDYDEFMAEIIKANNIALPKLPHYQEYGYDEVQHKLVILEYPDRKNNPGY